MPRRTTTAVHALTLWLCVPAPGPAVASEEFSFFREDVMGTSFELRVVADTPAAAAAAEARALAEVDRLSAVLSGYDPHSALARWQAAPGAGPAAVPPELLDVLAAADRARAATSGAFDPRAAAAGRLWAAAAGSGREPAAGDLAAAVRGAAAPAYRVDVPGGAAERLTACPLTFDGISKGYVVARAAGAALGPGCRGALLNVGGDLRACGEGGWVVGVVDPRADTETGAPLSRVRVRGASVSTSGGSQRGYRVGGRRQSHVVDPRTGRPAGGALGASVVSADGPAADALATAFTVLSPAESLRVAASVPGVECLVVANDGTVHKSEGWRRFEVEAAAPEPLALKAAPGPEKGKPWDEGFELSVKFELNNPSASRGFRRPYVAIWVEDEQGFPVRTLTLWGRGRWVTDLKRWHQGDQARRLVDDLDLRETVSRPTRPPGKYESVWDGKDDHGAGLSAGRYTVFIEAAREHGTYQKIQTQVELAGKPFAEELKGNVEIRSASIEYRRKGQAK